LRWLERLAVQQRRWQMVLIGGTQRHSSNSERHF
jgi:hypothetical protein